MKRNPGKLWIPIIAGIRHSRRLPPVDTCGVRLRGGYCGEQSVASVPTNLGELGLCAADWGVLVETDSLLEVHVRANRKPRTEAGLP